MLRRIIALFIAALCLLSAGMAESPDTSANACRDITEECKIAVSATHNSTAYLQDRNRKSSMTAYGVKDFIVTVTPGETPVAGVYIEFGSDCLPYRVEVKNASGEWECIAVQENSTYPQSYLQFPAQTDAFRMVFYQEKREKQLALRELFLLSEGELSSDYNHDWQPAVEKADLLLLTAHPDDEVLWFGGTLPYYAGELGAKVQSVCMTSYEHFRTLELLNSLWHCGVRNYPVVADFTDKQAPVMRKSYSDWGGEEKVVKYLVRILRQFRPEVVVTHDVKGEYGHTQHMVCADALPKAVQLANDPAYDPQSVTQYGAWQVKKLYVHLGEAPTTYMNWRQPLTAFGGKTGFEIAEEAFLRHVSQLVFTSFKVAPEGSDYDSFAYTLVHSTVGEDTVGGDFFENIPRECLSIH